MAVRRSDRLTKWRLLLSTPWALKMSATPRKMRYFSTDELTLLLKKSRSMSRKELVSTYSGLLRANTLQIKSTFS
jgi:hypothetical protein